MMKLSDLVAELLAQHGVRHVFMVTGGGAMHLNDSLGHHGLLTVVCTHHEQAAAMAAEGYARVTGMPGIVNVTTGPGGINALNGVFGAWTDSIPMLVISGQVKRETCMLFNRVPGLRQLGDQEVDIVRMAQGITKYAVTVPEPDSIRYHLEKALSLATTGRPGPCWVDIPSDVQAAMVDEDGLAGYSHDRDQLRVEPADLVAVCRKVIDLIRGASRPVIMGGTGVRLAGAVELFNRVARRLGIPVTTAWTHDLIASDDPLFCGRPGTIGTRAGNFTVQNADLLLVIGSRLNIRQVSYNWDAFARHAFKIQVDIDPAELAKPTVKPDMPICCDARIFLEEMDRQLAAMSYDPAAHAKWLEWCRERVERYPVVTEEKRRFNGRINPYHFVEVLFQQLTEDDVVVCGDGAACIVPFQAARLKMGQRMFSNSGAASMGWDLPAAVGAAVARGGRRVICLAGDGSIQLNIQELQTVIHHKLPIKLFIMNNGGYLSIRTTQRNFFGRVVGESPRSGVSFPDMVRIATAYGIPAMRIDQGEFVGMVREALATAGPVLVDVMMDPEQEFEPRIRSRQLPDGRIVSAPLEDMYPFLERHELLQNLLIPPML